MDSKKISHLIALAAQATQSGMESAKGTVVSLADYASVKIAHVEQAIHDPSTEKMLDDFILNRIDVKKIVVDRLNRGDQRTRINAKLAFVLSHAGKKGKEMAFALVRAAGRKDPLSVFDAVKSGAVFASTILHLMEARKKKSA